MSLYKGKLHRIQSHKDGHEIDELQTLRSATDLLSHRMAEMCDVDDGFDADLLGSVALTVSDLCEMAYQREEEREKEQKKARPC